MDEDEDYTPRSRTKKKSALSKRAAKKKSSVLSDEDNISGSYESFSPGYGRISEDNKYGSSSSHRYPLEAEVRIHHNMDQDEEDSDEGISIERSSKNSRYSSSYHTPSDSTINKLRGMNVTEDYDGVPYERRVPPRKSQSDSYKGEKRFRDSNSDGDEFKQHSGSLGKRKSTTGVNGPPDSHLIRVSSGERPVLSRPHIMLSDHDDSHDNMDIDDQTGYNGHLNQTSDSIQGIRNNYKKVLTPNISRSDIDLRKHELLDLATYNMDPKRTVSLSQADVGNSMDEIKDSLSDLRSFGQPRPSNLSPTQGHRQTGPDMRPWSGSLSLMRERSTDMLSERSYASTSAMPQMTPRQAKQRSYLLGSSVNGGALLGTEELDRLFPERQMKVFVGSWNMCEMKIIPPSLDDFVHPDSLNNVCDMYIFGTQESCSNRREWEVRLQEALGPHHVLIHSAAFGVLYLMAFVRKDLIWYCSVSEESSCSTRPGPSGFKTKGGVGLCFTLFGTSFLFINCHMTPHDGHIKERIEDYKKICRTIDLPKINKNAQTDHMDPTDVCSKFDCVFWCGDMNWRIVKEHERVKQKIGGIKAQDFPAYEDLLEHDELTQVRNQEQAFTKFQEGRIKFQPTFKYDKGTDNFDTSAKLRIPSYTDRILFRSKKKGGITCLHYDSASTVKESDHRPVYGMYEVNLRPGRDNIPLSAGQFNREVWAAAMKRRALKLDVLQKVKSEKSSSVCTIQ